MDDAHRLFLQAFMSHGILTSTQVKDFYKLACTRYREEVDISKEGLGDFVQTINKHLRSLRLQIKKGISEDTGKQFYSLVNTEESEMTRLASDYAVHELEFYKKIVEKVVMSDVGVLSSIDALNFEQGEGLKRMSKDTTEKLLKRMANDNWLDISKQGDISLSTRALLELDVYIEEQYSEHAVKCELCKRLCMKGQYCNNCDVKIHLFCAAKYFSEGRDCRCPSSHCNTVWPHRVPQIATSDPSASQGSQSSQQSRSARHSARH